MNKPSDSRIAHSDEPRVRPHRDREKPLVSIVVPCFNNESYVAEAIDSALGQTYDNIEVIVIDDGSTDGSLDIIRSYGDRIIWRTGPNEGACVARNIGLQLASGDCVKFLDADDLLCSDCIAVQVAQHTSRSDANEVIFGDHAVMDGSGRAFVGRRIYNNTLHDGDTASLSFLLRHGPLTSEPLHHRRMLCSVGGFRHDVRRGQEYELHLRLFARGAQFRYKPLVAYRIRDHSSATRISIASQAHHHFSNPEAFVELYEYFKGHSDRVSQDVRIALARQVWHVGRSRLRAGQKDTALQLFETARKICPENSCHGTRFYRFAYAAAGPVLAERIGSLTARVRIATGISTRATVAERE